VRSASRSANIDFRRALAIAKERAKQLKRQSRREKGKSMDTITAIKLIPAGARKVLDAALAAAVPTGRPVSVAVCDEGGHLMAFQRSDDAEL
jgi:tellurite resistance protein